MKENTGRKIRFSIGRKTIALFLLGALSLFMFDVPQFVDSPDAIDSFVSLEIKSSVDNNNPESNHSPEGRSSADNNNHESHRSAEGVDPNTVYAWVHIPKTGGSEAYFWYMKTLQQKLNATIYPDTQNKGAPYDWNSPGCVESPVHGGTHCSGSEIDHCLRHKIYNTNNSSKITNVKFLSILRHPVDRVISEYFWWGAKKKPPFAWTRSLFDASFANITKWILDESNTAHNRQALYFLLDQGFPETIECVTFDGDKTMDYIRQRYGSISALNQESLPEGILDQYSFIGLLEDVESSTQAFHNTFGIPPTIPKPKRKSHSSGSDKSAIDPSILSLIEERNQLDIQLYNQVLLKWHKRL